MMIAVDAAGGDYAPHEVVKGAAAAVEEYGVDVALVGIRAPLEMLVRRYEVEPSLTIVEATEVIGCNEPPVQAIRSKPDSSIVVGTKLVRDGLASAFISAGNTGAVVGAAFLNLARIEGVQRPALCGVFPIDAASTALLIDVGANVDCRPEFLVQFAQLGNFFARSVLGIDSPRVGLLNGSEENIEANILAEKSYQLLEKTNLNFIGNIGGQDILTGKADVIATDGFTGNVVLKTIEGLGDIVQNLMSAEQAFKISSDLRGTALVHYSQLACMVVGAGGAGGAPTTNGNFGDATTVAYASLILTALGGTGGLVGFDGDFGPGGAGRGFTIGDGAIYPIINALGTSVNGGQISGVDGQIGTIIYPIHGGSSGGAGIYVNDVSDGGFGGDFLTNKGGIGGNGGNETAGGGGAAGYNGNGGDGGGINGQSAADNSGAGGGGAAGFDFASEGNTGGNGGSGGVILTFYL